MKITLCGSTRFMDQFREWNVKLTMAGHIVYSVAASVKMDWLPTIEEKTHLDLIHLAKIEESDAIFVINVDGYIGESTAREIAWANIRGKKIFRLTHTQHHTLLGVTS